VDESRTYSYLFFHKVEFLNITFFSAGH
jgi:hypothetical protein